MDDYLSKPISPKALIDKVERWAPRDSGRIAEPVEIPRYGAITP
jgi:hypothetical protein